MKSPGKRWVWIPVTAMIVAGGLLTWRFAHRGEMPVPDERAAGVALLAQQQDGPGYFHAVKAEPTPFDEGGPWITVQEARSQAGRIASERHFAPEKAGALDRLISQLAEPHPSRVVGGERIPLVRLNLALDGL